MPTLLTPLRTCLLLSLTILSVLTQQIILDKFNTEEIMHDGEIKIFIDPSYSDQNQDVSLFGWIKINSTSASADIFDLCYGECPNDDPTNHGVFLFSLQFVAWTDPSLRISFVTKGEAVKESTMPLLPSELDSWLFVYLGHSFVHSRSSYYKESLSNTQKILIDEVVLKPTHNSKAKYQLLTGINEYLQRKMFIGEIQRLTIQFGDRAYKENGIEYLQTLHPNTLSRLNCSVFFTECAYTGEAIHACRATADYPIMNIKSVVFRNPNKDYVCWNEKKIIVNKNVQCIPDAINWMDVSQTEESGYNSCGE